MDFINTKNATFYHEDKENYVKRFYVLMSNDDTRSSEKNKLFLKKNIYQNYYNLGLDYAFLESIGIYLNKGYCSCIFHTFTYPPGSNIEEMEKDILFEANKLNYIFQPLEVKLNAELFLNAQLNGKLDSNISNSSKEKLLILTEDMIMPHDINNIQSFVIDKLNVLSSENNTLIITDAYLFPKNYDDEYKCNLIEILKSTKASKIKFYGSENNISNKLYECVKNKLANDNITLELINLNHFHDRFWIVEENYNGLVFGTSINGLCKKVFYMNVLSEDEGKIIIDYINSQL